MDTKYVALVWTDDIANFSKEFEKTSLPKEIERLVVVGANIRVEDLLKLRELEGVDYDIFPVFGPKTLTEIYFLGRCQATAEKEAEEIGLAGYSPLDKETLEFAKNAQIPVANFKQLKNAPSQRQPKSKSGESKKNTGETKPDKKQPLVTETKKKTKSTGVLKSIEQVLKKSGLSQETYAFFTEEKNTLVIKDAIKNAFDAKIGLPFQLKMRFGNKSSLIESALVENFEKLRKEVDNE